MSSAVSVPLMYGVGSGGSRMVDALRSQVRSVRACAVTSSASDLDSLKHSDYRFVIGGRGAGADPRVGRKLYLESPQRREIVELPSIVSERVEVIPVMVSAGHGTGSGCGPALVEDLRRRYPEALVLPFSTLPFEFEGREVFRRAWETLKELGKTGPVVPVSNKHLSAGKEYLDEALSSVNSAILRVISPVLQALSSPAEMLGFDVSDMKRALGKGAVAVLQWRPQTLDGLVGEQPSTLAAYTPGELRRGLSLVLALVETAQRLPISTVDSLVYDALERGLNCTVRELKLLVRRSHRNLITVVIGGLKIG